ncbi:MAG: hypothetical protein KF760_28435 [Candidatus Eremiobacteraeota bacterium]|nr:hypothetical protein [Candidatus Eremiobacteraeota bacterium]
MREHFRTEAPLRLTPEQARGLSEDLLERLKGREFVRVETRAGFERGEKALITIRIVDPEAPYYDHRHGAGFT